MSEISNNDGSVTITPGCDIVASVLDGLKTELKAIINDKPAKLTIDFTGITMIDSMGIGILIATFNSLKKQNAPLELINVSDEIANLLRNMRLNQYFTIA
jgi:anti-anti-sigma factor